MKKIKLYRVGNTVSPIKPNEAYETLWRLVADEGRALYDGENTVPAIDTEAPDKWNEVAIDEATKAIDEALKILR